MFAAITTTLIAMPTIIHLFLPSSSDSKARFKLFKKGSGLEIIEEEMETSEELQKSIAIELKRRKDVG